MLSKENVNEKDLINSYFYKHQIKKTSKRIEKN